MRRGHRARQKGISRRRQPRGRRGSRAVGRGDDAQIREVCNRLAFRGLSEGNNHAATPVGDIEGNGE